MGEEQVVPTSFSHSKILQWLQMDNSINITLTGIQAILSIFIIHSMAIANLQLILSTPYASAKQPREFAPFYFHALHMLYSLSAILLFQYLSTYFYLRLIPNDTTSMRQFLILTHPLPSNAQLLIVFPLNPKVVCNSCLAFHFVLSQVLVWLPLYMLLGDETRSTHLFSSQYLAQRLE